MCKCLQCGPLCHQGGLNACLLTSVFVSSLTMLARESLSLIKAAFIFRHHTIKAFGNGEKAVDNVTKKPFSRKFAASEPGQRSLLAAAEIISLALIPDFAFLICPSPSQCYWCV